MKQPITHQDLRRINALLHQLSKKESPLVKENLEQILADPKFWMIVARSPRGNILGMASIAITFDFPKRVARIGGVVVDKRHRGKGIGKYLMRELHDIARMHNIRFIELTSNTERTEALPLYEKLGYIKPETNYLRFCFQK